MPELGDYDKNVEEAHHATLAARSAMDLAERLGAEEEASGYRREFYDALLSLSYQEDIRHHIISEYVESELERLKPYEPHTLPLSARDRDGGR